MTDNVTSSVIEEPRPRRESVSHRLALALERSINYLNEDFLRCVSCEGSSMVSKRHSICYDCILDTSSNAKIFTQGFDVSSNPGMRTCIICLETGAFVGRRHLICQDCLVGRLGDLTLLNFNSRKTFYNNSIIAGTSRISSVYTDILRWSTVTNITCDICKTSISSLRKERVCLDCIIDNLIRTRNFGIRDRRVYTI